jgi:thiamine biosynthesis lipoprotein
MSVSAVWGKAFEADGRVFGHVLDPRRGEPVEGAVLAAAVTRSATEADAYSTALLVLGAEGFDRFDHTDPEAGLLVVESGPVAEPARVTARGILAPLIGGA